MIPAGPEIEALHMPVLAVVVVPADNIILVRVRLLSDTIVEAEYPVRLLDLPHLRLDNGP